MDDKQKGTFGEYYLRRRIQRAPAAEVCLEDNSARQVLYSVNKKIRKQTYFVIESNTNIFKAIKHAKCSSKERINPLELLELSMKV